MTNIFIRFLTKFGLSWQIYTKSSLPNFTEIHPLAGALVHADKWTGRWIW